MLRFILPALLVACGPPEAPATLDVGLTARVAEGSAASDADQDGEGLYLVVGEVRLHQVDGAEWVVLADEVGEVRADDLGDDAKATLGDSLVPPGWYNLVQLQVLDAWWVDGEGEVQPVELPSGAQSGLKITTSFCLEPDAAEALELSWDVEGNLMEAGGLRLAPALYVDHGPACEGPGRPDQAGRP